MLELNIANVITVGLASVGVYALLQWLLAQFHISIPYVNA